MMKDYARLLWKKQSNAYFKFAPEETNQTRTIHSLKIKTKTNFWFETKRKFF